MVVTKNMFWLQDGVKEKRGSMEETGIYSRDGREATPEKMVMPAEVTVMVDFDGRP